MLISLEDLMALMKCRGGEWGCILPKAVVCNIRETVSAEGL